MSYSIPLIERHFFKNLSLILFLLLFSCAGKKHQVPKEEPFRIKTHQISMPTMLKSVHSFKGDFLFLTEDGEVFVLDSLYRHKIETEKLLLTEKVSGIYEYMDTLWIAKYTQSGNDPMWYYLDSTYKLNYISRPDFYNSPIPSLRDILFVDDKYIVFGGCAGEFGGTVFFYNKAEKKTYSYPATCPSQVLFHENSYYLINNLAHLGEHTSLLKFSNPSLLYEIPNVTEYFDMNPLAGRDSISGQEYDQNEEVLTRKGIKIFSKSWYTLTVISFIHSNKFYSLQQSDSGYSVVVFNDTPQTVQRFNSTVKFGYNIDAKFSKDVGIALLKEGWSSMDTTMIEKHNSSNIIIVRGNTIDILLCYNSVEIINK